MQFGVSYYPELVAEAEWGRDLDRMREAGLSVVRMLEFAWSWFEPREGEYDFAPLDRFLGLIEERQMKVILGTPTASPPAWLFRQYPQIGCVLANGRRLGYGGRRNACVNSSVYRSFSRRIAGVLAGRYGSSPEVLGWQIDNELIGPEVRDEFLCHCEDCQFQFRNWLKQRYGIIRALNDAWGLRFWSMEFSEWGQVQTPARGGSAGHQLDAYRFYSDSQVEYIKLQYDAMKPSIDADQFISHNSTGIFDRGIDHRAYSRALDVAGWDAYTGAAAADHPTKLPFTGLANDLFRSSLHKPFWVFETDTNGNQSPAYLAGLAARGATGVIFWHWRQHRAGCEQLNPALCDHAGTPHEERMSMVKSTISRLQKLPALAERLAPRSAAILFTPDCVREQHRRRDRPIPYLDSVVTAYEPFWRNGIAMDVVYPNEDLSPYRLVVMPSLSLLGVEQAERIRTFVRRGGVLLASGVCGDKDLNGVFYPDSGGLLHDVLGIASLGRDARSSDVGIRTADGQALTGSRGTRIESLTTARVLATHAESDGGDPAAVENAFGEGRAFYLAARGGDASRWLARLSADAAGLDWLESPREGVHVMPHLSSPAVWYFNHGKSPAEVEGVVIPANDFALRESPAHGSNQSPRASSPLGAAATSARSALGTSKASGADGRLLIS